MTKKANVAKLLVVAATVLAMAGCSATQGTASAGSTSAAGQSNSNASTKKVQYPFSDTGTFNDASPDAPSVTGANLDKLGSVPTLPSSIKIGVLLKTLTNPYWQEVERGLQDAQKKYGVKIGPIQASESETNTSEQLQICNSMLLQGYSALIVAPETTSNLNPCLNKFKAANIPLINIAAPGTGVTASIYVGSALATEGQYGGQYFAAHLPKGSEVAQIEGLPGSAAADLRASGFEAGIKGTGLTLVASVAANWDQQTAYNQTVTLLGRYPNLKAIYSANDDMAVAVIKAVQQAKRHVLVFGTDGTPQAINSISQGAETATATPFPYYEGYWSLEGTVRLLGGQKVPLWLNTADKVITTTNVSQYFTTDGKAKPGLFNTGK